MRAVAPKFFPVLAALIFLGLASAVSANTIREVRVAQNEGFIRAVIETREAPTFRYRNASRDEGRVSVELRAIRSAPDNVNVLGNIAKLRSAATEHQRSHGLYYLHLELDGEVRVESTRLTDPHRLVLDFYPGEAATSSPLPISRPSSDASASSGGSSASNVAASGPMRTPPSGYRPRIIVIDPGHGGRHRGGIGRVGGRQIDEAMVTLPVSLKLEQLLRSDPLLEPRLTRRSDVYVGLRERTRLAEQFKGDMFLSIHYNAVPEGRPPTSARGLEFYTWSPREGDTVAERYLQALNNEEGKTSDLSRADRSARPVLNKMMLDALLAQSLDSRVVAEHLEKAFLKDSYFRRHYRGIKDGRFRVLENYNMPSVLIEIAFISHPEEARMSMDSAFQDKVARMMYEGIVTYYEQTDPAFRAARARMLASR